MILQTQHIVYKRCLHTANQKDIKARQRKSITSIRYYLVVKTPTDLALAVRRWILIPLLCELHLFESLTPRKYNFRPILFSFIWPTLLAGEFKTVRIFYVTLEHITVSGRSKAKWFACAKRQKLHCMRYTCV